MRSFHSPEGRQLAQLMLAALHGSWVLCLSGICEPMNQYDKRGPNYRELPLRIEPISRYDREAFCMPLVVFGDEMLLLIGGK